MNTANQKYCYISHPLNAQKVDDLRPILNNVLLERNYQPFYANQTYEGNTILFGTCKNIYLADLCVFEIAKSYPQIYIEIGIALAYNKPIIIIVDKEHYGPLMLQGFSIVSYSGYLDIPNKLGNIIDNLLNQIYPDDDNFCKFCNQICESMLISQNKNSFVILNKAGLLQRGDWDQINHIMSLYFSEYHMYPIHSTDIIAQNRLCDVRRKVYSSRFALIIRGICPTS